MPTQPDIIVTGEWPSDYRLVVEVKVRGEAEAAETQLMRHLIDYNCSFGLLVTADELRVVKDTGRYLGMTTYERIAVHPLPEELRVHATSEVVLARAVQDWLERLVDQGIDIVEDDDLAATLRDEVIPRLRGSDISAGRPPWPVEAVAR
ncbi:MAG: hypothetical protein ABMA64_13650 [Myxococcota bacterium]